MDAAGLRRPDHTAGAIPRCRPGRPLRLHRPDVSRAQGQAIEPGAAGRWQRLAQAKASGELDREGDGDVGHREPVFQKVIPSVREAGLGQPQPGEEPCRVILHDLRLPPLFRLEPPVAQDERLREGQRGIRVVQPVEIGAVFRVPGGHGESAAAVAHREVDGNRAGFGHPSLAVHQQRHGAERVLRKERLPQHARGEGEHLQLVIQPEFFQGPERPEGSCVVAVPELDHGALPKGDGPCIVPGAGRAASLAGESAPSLAAPIPPRMAVPGAGPAGNSTPASGASQADPLKTGVSAAPGRAEGQGAARSPDFFRPSVKKVLASHRSHL